MLKTINEKKEEEEMENETGDKKCSKILNAEIKEIVEYDWIKYRNTFMYSNYWTKYGII